MSQDIGNLAIVISGNASPLFNALNKAGGLLGQFRNNQQSQGEEPRGPGPSALAMTATGVAANLLSSALQSVAGLTMRAGTAAVQAAAQYELMTTSFGVMLGNADRGKAMVDSIQALAVATPFGSAELTSIGQQLLGMGIAAENVVPALSRIGDLAAGDSQKLQRLALAFGQVQAKGRLSGEELLQFSEAGIGIKDFADAAGMSMGRFRADMEAGKIGADVAVKAINKLTSQGGRFAGMNERASKTVIGQWNSLTESVTVSLTKIGVEAFDKLNIADRIGKLAEFLQPMTEMMGPIGAAFERLGPVIDNALKAAFGGAIPDSKTLFTALGNGIASVIGLFGQAATAAGHLFNGLRLLVGYGAPMISKVLGGAVLAVTAVMAGFLKALEGLARWSGKDDLAQTANAAAEALNGLKLYDGIRRVGDDISRLAQAAGGVKIAPAAVDIEFVPKGLDVPKELRANVKDLNATLSEGNLNAHEMAAALASIARDRGVEQNLAISMERTGVAEEVGRVKNLAAGAGDEAARLRGQLEDGAAAAAHLAKAMPPARTAMPAGRGLPKPAAPAELPAMSDEMGQVAALAAGAGLKAAELRDFLEGGAMTADQLAKAMSNVLGTTVTTSDLAAKFGKGLDELKAKAKGMPLITVPIQASADVQKLATDIQKQFELGGPLKHFQKAYRDLNSGMFHGLLNQDQVQFGVQRAFGELEKEFGKMLETKLPQAVAKGSKEAESIINKAIYKSTAKDPMDRIKQILELARKDQERTAKNTEQTYKAVKELDRIQPFKF